MFDFRLFNQVLEKEKIELDTQFESIGYLYHVMYHRLSNINFERFDLEDINEAINLLTMEITSEDVEGNVFLSPCHPLTVMDTACGNIMALNKMKKSRVPSSYQFI